ncbi:hypothetical protein NVV94_15700 [Pseudomonas sp. LS1212]|nr:hypothetical protein [Pseudomonas sp. LS1212]UVJ42105.1 hypothetical protein NVV94_15700 [Pseudomonas sp. LS1212]
MAEIMASTVPDLLFGANQPFPLKHAENSVGAKTLPGKTDHQRLKLFGTQLQLRTLVGAGPDESALVQAARRQPNPQAIVSQHFHAIAATIGKEISAMRLRRTKDRHDASQSISVPAHMSMGSVASQMVSMRIIASVLERIGHNPRELRLEMVST